MPKKQPASSSSSSEDLAAFESVAVSFEEITSKQKEVAEQAKQRLSGSRKHKRAAKKQQLGDGDEDDGGEDGDDETRPSDQLDAIQVKVATALDSLLGSRLKVKEPGPKRLRKEAKAAARAEEDATIGVDGFRFFARVQPGAAVILEPEEPPPHQGTPFPETFRQRRAPAADAAAAALPALAVDGEALLAAAAAATGRGAGACATLQAAADHHPRDGAVEPGGLTVGPTAGVVEQQRALARPGGPSPGGAVKAQPWKPKRQWGVGHVVEPPPFVPHDERMRRLVGGTAVAMVQ